MADTIRIKKGLDIPLEGKAPEENIMDVHTPEVGIVPDDYPGYHWKLEVKPGDRVSKGSPLMYARENQKIKLVSPISGRVSEVRRGERRHILAVVVSREITDSDEVRKFASQDLKELLCESGLWSLMRQRPYDIIPSADVTPRDIFITAFDSAPLAPEMISPADSLMLDEGIRALKTLTSGKVYLNVRFGSGISSNNAVVTEFQGPHPSGNAGVQIENIRPVNKGETVWTLDARTVVRIGKLVTRGILDTDSRVAVSGPLVKTPYIARCVTGVPVSALLQGHLPEDISDYRVISGNVLTGFRLSPVDGFLRYPYRQITVIREGACKDEFMGWASMSPKKYSVKRSFPAFFRGLGKPFDFDARIKGGHRAMILSGEYDKVFPMDIYPEFLVKAILARDIDKMEKLGIYEVAPEDFALPEFVDTSKLELQKIVREGLDYLRKELY